MVRHLLLKEDTLDQAVRGERPGGGEVSCIVHIVYVC